MKVRRQWLWGALLALGCGSSGTSSTGVGNPGVISLNVINDDDDVDAESGGAMSEGGGANATGGASDAGGATNGGGETGGTSNGGADVGGASNGGGDVGGAANGGAGVGAGDAPLAKGQVKHAILVLAGLRFLPCDIALQPTEVAGPFVLDLVEKTVLPRFPTVSGVAGGYCGIDAPLTPAKRPPAVAGRSLFFDGVRADGTPFLLYANMQATLRLRARPGSAWSPEETPHLLWAFRPRRWLNKSEVDTAEGELLGGARAIVIDVDRHPLLYAAIRMRLAGRSTLYLDVNDDGVLEPDERQRVLGDGSENAD